MANSARPMDETETEKTIVYWLLAWNSLYERFQYYNKPAKNASTRSLSSQMRQILFGRL